MESQIIQCRAELLKINGKLFSKLRRNTDIFLGVLTKLCRKNFVLVRGKKAHKGFHCFKHYFLCALPHNLNSNNRNYLK